MDLKAPGIVVDLHESRYAIFESASEDEMDVIFTGLENTLAGYKVDRPTFPYFALELVTGGRGEIELAGHSYPLQRGTFFTYGPGVPHTITTDPAQPMRKYFIDFSKPPADTPGALQAGRCSFTTMTDRMAMLLDSILQDSADGIDTPLVRQLSCRLLLELATISVDLDQQPHSAAYQNYLRVRSHIEANYQKSGSVCDFAQALHIDTAYLTRLFQRFGNETPYQFLTRLRLSRAGHLLLRHNLPIQQISDLLGFANPFHFSALFRRHYGMSPRQYRKSSQPKGKAKRSQAAENTAP